MVLRDGRRLRKVQRSLLAWKDEMRELYEQARAAPTGLRAFNLVSGTSRKFTAMRSFAPFMAAASRADLERAIERAIERILTAASAAVVFE